mmetsp:Transcript_47881/g.126754  ORF Transcript_47881/g.126754 Transcript_47881/m.126754 type:complete len:204 (+) Transcript_47881:92-703(+)
MDGQGADCQLPTLWAKRHLSPREQPLAEKKCLQTVGRLVTGTGAALAQVTYSLRSTPRLRFPPWASLRAARCLSKASKALCRSLFCFGFSLIRVRTSSTERTRPAAWRPANESKTKWPPRSSAESLLVPSHQSTVSSSPGRQGYQLASSVQKPSATPLATRRMAFWVADASPKPPQIHTPKKGHRAKPAPSMWSNEYFSARPS